MTDLLAALPDPTASVVRAARDAAAQTQTAAAAAVGCSRITWAQWEAGRSAIPASTWALYLLATDQHPAGRVIPTR